jgi:DnaJ-class molecular chaperone
MRYERGLIFQKECSQCDGEGKHHSPGRNGDPDDDGVTCTKCDGLGVIDVEIDEDGDEI